MEFNAISREKKLMLPVLENTIEWVVHFVAKIGILT